MTDLRKIKNVRRSFPAATVLYAMIEIDVLSETDHSRNGWSWQDGSSDDRDGRRMYVCGARGDYWTAWMIFYNGGEWGRIYWGDIQA